MNQRLEIFTNFYKVFVRIFAFKDTHRENTPSNKTQSPTKSISMEIWVVDTLSQLFLRGSHTQVKYLR